MFKSIQWKMGLLYFLLILIAMQVIGVQLLQSLQQYYENNYADGLTAQGELIGGLLRRYFTESLQEDYIASLVGEFRLETGAEIIVLDSNGVVLGASQGRSYLVGKRWGQPEISRALTGIKGQEIRWDPIRQERLMSTAIPVLDGRETVGVVYLSGSLAEIDRTLQDIRTFLLSATAIALIITAIIGAGLARTITRPIQEVTQKAALIAAGDFDQRITIRSADEIGQLGETFNYLSSRLQETLREIAHQKNKVEAILTNMNDGVLALDEGGSLIHSNPAACRMLGLKEEEALGKPWQEIPVLEQLEPVLEEVWAHKKNISTQLVVVQKNPRVIQVHLTPLGDVGENLRGTVIALHDITEQEKLESMRKDFVANVSHELKTPITTIKSYVETLLDGAVTDEKLVIPFLNVVATETDRMARLVRDLLQLSQLDYEEVRWEKRPLALPELVQNAARRWLVEMEKKKLCLALDLAPDLPLVLADKDRVEQVLENLLSNAVKFTPEGGSITITGAAEENFVRVVIADTGIGIPPEDQSRIFERFYRVDKARSRSQGGTGLGLSIAQELIRAQGGDITLDSEPGKGTRVSFTLPVATPLPSTDNRPPTTDIGGIAKCLWKK
ncbi:MAG: ATP-binding protein [bacterium]|jgi:two-component system sensor histidine kinase VicK|nr:ATP-binding protein [Bacillota bacterium]HHW56036.1 cell wall metabolism sensor histidine kinase WalK [Bacillota bacterium]